ncbi:MAG: ribonuclease P protein component [Alteromonadaceae bacterium]|uniref:ribonuclease P protein component n=1 Tax=unclassified Marinobacter TaxID=83889 RepID=UPI000C44830B|nr:ribonuclease P protein component [Marinobacter sp. BGYM27]MAA64787.1 ribonuclease P protein component [Alteromonadaceae bacterium]MBH87075.1 ribonuclease P protein component [Alteromonadaceae bacterium]MDG5501574.1 ribonuclease P protein component [Marinobacter sp. BGYM27]|tara:strand:- start:138 stop:512 length:375 start_codon:yes stop_codon:yes gene_type:complete
MPVLTFPKQARLLKPRDYSGVFDHVSVRVPHRHFLILAAPNDRGHARVGLIFSKKNLRLAVQRNRIKRAVRETFRLQSDLPPMDIIVMGRQGLADLENASVNGILEDLWQRLRRKARKADAASG